MHKWQFAGCALSALVVSTCAASAQDFKVTLSGEAKFQAMAASQDKDKDTRAVDFRNRFRFVVNPEASAFNGALTYGARVKIKNEAANTDGGTTFEEAYIYGQGAFGKVYFGNVAPFNDDNGGVTRPADFLSEDDGFLGFVGSSKDPAYASGTLAAWRSKTATLGEQASKVRYDTPAIYGLKLGIGYTPSSNGNVDAWQWNRASKDSTRRVQDAFEVGVMFDSTDKSVADKFGSAVLKASADYQSAKNSDSGREKFNWYQAGVQVGYSGFTVGGHYVYKGKSDLLKTDPSQDDDFSWGAGAQYVTGPWKAGIGYNGSERDGNSSGRGKQKADYLTAGVMYSVAKGLDVGLNYAYVQTKYTDAGTPDLKDNSSIFGADIVLGF